MSFLYDCDVPSDRNLLGASVSIEPKAPVVDVTAGVSTYPADGLLRGVYVRDPSGASRADVFPTAALLVAALANKYGVARVGMIVELMHVNSADAAETITMTLGAGMTNGNLPQAAGNVTAAIAQNATRLWKFRLTNVTSGAEAVTVYA